LRRRRQRRRGRCQSLQSASRVAFGIAAYHGVNVFGGLQSSQCRRVLPSVGEFGGKIGGKEKTRPSVPVPISRRSWRRLLGAAVVPRRSRLYFWISPSSACTRSAITRQGVPNAKTHDQAESEAESEQCEVDFHLFLPRAACAPKKKGPAMGINQQQPRVWGRPRMGARS
jgi:hypothetical protein